MNQSAIQDGWRGVSGNGFGCDLCDNVKVVGWVQITLPDRSLGNWRDNPIFMVCAEHIKLGVPVFPALAPNNKIESKS